MAEPRILIVGGSGIRPYPKVAPSQANLEESKGLAAGVKYAKIFKNGTIEKKTTMRLDNQGKLGDWGANLQMQINGVGRPSTLAQVLVGKSLMEGIFSTTEGAKYHEAIAKAVREALVKSLESKKTYVVKLG